MDNQLPKVSCKLIFTFSLKLQYVYLKFVFINYVRAPIYLTSSNLVSKQFDEAKDKITTLKEEPSNEIKLKIYALFKQATVGKCNTKKPGMTDFVGR